MKCLIVQVNVKFSFTITPYQNVKKIILPLSDEKNYFNLKKRKQHLKVNICLVENIILNKLQKIYKKQAMFLT